MFIQMNHGCICTLAIQFMIKKKVESLEKMANNTVLLLTTEYGDHIIGGLGRHVNDLVGEGTKCGLTYIVVTISKTNTESYIVEDGVHVFRLLPWQRKSGDFFDYIRNINFRFSQFVLQELHLSFDLIHAHDWLTGIAGIQLKSMLKRPLLTTIHAHEMGRKQGIVNSAVSRIMEYEKNIIKFSDRLIVCSLFMQNVLINEYNCPIDRIEVIPNGVIPSNYKSELNIEEILNTFAFIYSPYLLAMGRLVEEKGFQILIKAFSEIEEDYSKLRLVISGKGPFYKNLKKLTKDLKLENKVFFTGFVKELERNTLLLNSEMVVIPSLYEPFGIIALESMVVGKPTLAFKTGGLAEILANNRGGLIQDKSSDGLATTLDFYLSSSGRARQIAETGSEAAHSMYDWSILIKKTVEVYMKTL
jgi:glycogen synthase